MILKLKITPRIVKGKSKGEIITKLTNGKAQTFSNYGNYFTELNFRVYNEEKNITVFNLHKINMKTEQKKISVEKGRGMKQFLKLTPKQKEKAILSSEITESKIVRQKEWIAYV